MSDLLASVRPSVPFAVQHNDVLSKYTQSVVVVAPPLILLPPRSACSSSSSAASGPRRPIDNRQKRIGRKVKCKNGERIRPAVPLQLAAKGGEDTHALPEVVCKVSPKQARAKYVVCTYTHGRTDRRERLAMSARAWGRRQNARSLARSFAPPPPRASSSQGRTGGPLYVYCTYRRLHGRKEGR